MNPILTSFTDFLLGNLWWIVTLTALLVVGVFALVVFLVKRNKKAHPAKPRFSVTAYTEALGGADNILSHELKGSRIVLKLRDYRAIDRVKIKEAGVDGFIEKSDLLTLVVKDDAPKVYKALFGE